MMSSEMEDGGVGIVLNAQPRRQSSATMELNRQPGPDYEPKHHEPLSSSSFASIDFASKSELGSPKAAIAGGTAHSSSVKAKLSALKTQQRSASSTTSNSPLVKKRLQWNNDLAATKTIIDAGDDSEDYEDGRLRMAKDNDDDADSDTEYAYQSKYQELMHSMGSLDDIGNAEGMGESSVAVDDRPLSFADQLRQEKVLEMAKKSRRLYVALERERSKSKILLRRVQELESLNASQITDTSSGGSLQNLSAVRSDSGLLNNTDSVTALDVQSSLKQFKDKINQISRRLEEEKTQNHLLKQELRQANRALAQEIGEEMTVQKILSAGAGWKGRAQQIAALRDKITKLNIQFQQQQQQQQEPHNHGQPYRNRHPGGTTHQPEMSLVDKQDPLWQQQQSLEKHRQRQQLQHAQTELAVYQGKYEALNTKFQSLKTRNGVLEETAKQLKHQIQVLMDKNDIDDQMITNLKIQVSKLQVKQDPTPPPLAKDFEEREQYLKRLRELLKEMDDHRNKLRFKSEIYASEHLIAALNTENAMLWEMQRELETRLENAEHYCRQLATDLYKEKHKLNPVPQVKSSAAIKDDTLLKMQKKLELQHDEIQALKSTLESITEQKNQDLRSYQQIIRHLKQQQQE